MMARKTKEVVGEVKKTTVRDVVYAILPVVSIALLVGLWIWVSQKYPLLFPSPAQTWERLVKLFKVPVMRVSYPGHILNRKMDAFFGTIFAFIRPIPPIAWIPLITILMGTSEASKILIVFIGAVMPVVINTHDGVRNVEKLYLDVGEVFNANKRQMLMEIAVPAAYPSIFAGIRTSTSTAWMVVLAAEMLGANRGVGFLVVKGMDSNDLPLVLVAMITIGVIGALLAVLTGYIEGRLWPWNKKK